MSIGIGGSSRKVLEDDHTVIYEYFCYNLNKEEFNRPKKKFDGIIAIDKSALVEPILREKRKRNLRGKKRIFIKRIPVEISVEALIKEAKVEIENCSCAWNFTSNKIDRIALLICEKIFLSYQREGCLPEEMGYHK